MQHTHERGRFFIGPNGFPRFAGSSSGVYLADTIRTELGNESPDQQGVETEIEQAFIARNTGKSSDAITQLYEHEILRVGDLRLNAELRDCITQYFARWHPLFPFLDGVYLIQCFDNATDMARSCGETLADRNDQTDIASRPAFSGLSSEEGLILSATFLSIFALGRLDNASASDNLLPSAILSPGLRSPSHATKLAHQIIEIIQTAKVNDLFALQSLLAIQLYLYASRALRPAMHMSGTLIKLAYEGGLHRCPDRYRNTFTLSSARQLRKRVFYSLYTLDRVLSAEFGTPIMMHDSDIDTCLPGSVEKHCNDHIPDLTGVLDSRAVSVAGVKRKRVEKVVGSSCESVTSASVREASPVLVPHEKESEAVRFRLLAANALSRMATMTGRAMEAFNKSLKHRTLDPEEALLLRADTDRWWNDLGMDSEEDPMVVDPRRRYHTLFKCLYHQQIINLNRPALSLTPSEINHACGLQSSIASARIILSLLSGTSEQKDLFWPGYVDMVFFSCLLLVYDCRRNVQTPSSRTRLHADLKRALGILELLHCRWNNLAGFVKVVRAFIKRIDPSTEESGQQAADTIMPTLLQNVFSDDSQIADPSSSDFFFDFSSFELNPDSTWAYHASVPGSPADRFDA